MCASVHMHTTIGQCCVLVGSFTDTITACVTDDEAGIRNISSTNEYDTNCSKPLPFSAEYEGPVVEPGTVSILIVHIYSCYDICVFCKTFQRE